MYTEGVKKNLLALLIAILLVVGLSYWSQTHFMVKFVWDLIVINLKSLWEATRPYLPFQHV